MISFRHLFACALLCSAAASAEPPGPPPTSVASGTALMCDGLQLKEGVVPPRECGIWPSTPARVIPGLDAMPAPVRECVLTNLPGTAKDTQPGWCQRWSGDVLRDRLQQLGWLDAQVAPGGTASGAQLPPLWLKVQLGERYQVGPIEVRFAGTSKSKPDDIVSEARRAIPEGASWYHPGVAEAMQARLLQQGTFQKVEVRGGTPDREQHLVPLTIEVTEVSTARKRAPRCKGQIGCPFGESCQLDKKRRCEVCRCTIRYGG